MQSTQRRGDITGIAFLMALIAAAFVPAVLNEAGRAFPPGTIRRAPLVHHHESIRLVAGTPGTTLARLELELPSESSTTPANDSTRLVPNRDAMEPIASSSILIPRAAGPPRRHEPRGPPAPCCRFFHV